MDANEAVPHLRLAKCFNSKFKKLTILVRDAQNMKTIHSVLLMADAQPKLGRAPMGAQARIVAKALDELEAEADD